MFSTQRTRSQTNKREFSVRHGLIQWGKVPGTGDRTGSVSLEATSVCYVTSSRCDRECRSPFIKDRTSGSKMVCRGRRVRGGGGVCVKVKDETPETSPKILCDGSVRTIHTYGGLRSSKLKTGLQEGSLTSTGCLNGGGSYTGETSCRVELPVRLRPDVSEVSSEQRHLSKRQLSRPPYPTPEPSLT